MFAVDIHKCPSVDIGHAAAAEHLANGAIAKRHGRIAVHLAFVTAAIDVAAYANLGRKVQGTEQQPPQEEQPPVCTGSIGHIWFHQDIRHIMVSLLTLSLDC